MILIVAGSPGSGKSAFCKFMQSQGAGYIDCDGVVGDLYKNGEAGSKAVEENYGEDFLNEDGSVCKDKLRKLAFSSTEEMKKISELIQPLVLDRVKKVLKNMDNELIFIEAINPHVLAPLSAKLIEVVSPISSAISRSKKKGISEQMYKLIVQNQEHRDSANYVVRNESDLKGLEIEASTLLQKLKNL